MKNFLPLTTLCLALIWPWAAAAEPCTNAFVCWATQDYMLGDWGGLRSDLSRNGADFEFFYAGSVPDNLAGGRRTGAVYQGAMLATLDLDSEKLLGYAGGKFHVSSLWLHGRKPFSADYSGDLNRVNLLDFDNAFRLWELSYQQKFFGDKLSVKLGELSVDSDFIVPEYYYSFGQFTFLNQTFFYPTLPYNVFDTPGFPVMHHGLATTPLAAPGAVLGWTTAKSFYVQAGIYSGTPDQTESGARFNLSQRDGVLNYFEMGWRRNAGTNNSGLGGTYKIGGYYHTSDFTDAYDGVFYAAGINSSPRQHRGDYGLYFLAEQQLFLENGKTDPAQQGLVGFFRALAAPADRNLTQLELDAGFVYRGLIPTRDWDTISLAVSHLEFSDDLRRAQEDINAFAPGSFVPADYEDVVELNYKIQATAWWTVQASLQHVFHPGGSSALPDATALILQTSLRF